MKPITVIRKGQEISFISNYQDTQVVVVLKQLVENGALGWSDFARSLATSKKLSDKQLAWAHKLVFDYEAKQEKPKKVEEVAAMQVPQILAMLNLAAETLKNPKINLDTSTGGRVRLKMSGAASKYPGTIWITDGGKYGEAITYGHIRTNGDLFWKGDVIDSVQQVIETLEHDPSATASAYGKRTSNCCFCNTKIETAESLAVGYGPVCAGRYGLPWGVDKASSIVHLRKEIAQLERMTEDATE